MQFELCSFQYLVAILAALIIESALQPAAYLANFNYLYKYKKPSVPSKATVVLHSTNNNFVYRAVNLDDLRHILQGEDILSSRGNGHAISDLLKPCPTGSGPNCPICHVGLDNKSGGSDFISTSKSMRQAGYYNKRGVVRIDLDKVDPSSIFDLTNEETRAKLLTNRFNDDASHEGVSQDAKEESRINEEVLIKCFIPKDAYVFHSSKARR
jgi:hypothetical protein